MNVPAIIVAAVALLATTVYAIFGGADFGGGVWDLLATGKLRRQQRGAVVTAIGPVWETNHIWIIFLIVLLFTCFPAAFARFAVALYIPLTVVMVGIVLRGAAFVFRGYAHEAAGTSFIWGRIFGTASVITPLAYGASAGAVFAGSFDWHSPFALTIGVFALAVCAQLAAIFLTCETTGDLQDDFRTRSLFACVAIAVVGALALAIAFMTEPRVVHALFRPRGMAGIGAAMLVGVTVFGAVWYRMFLVARALVAIEVAAILVGWYGSQAPDLIPGSLTFADAAAPASTLVAFLWVVLAGAVLFIPSLLLLFAVFKGRNPAAE